MAKKDNVHQIRLSKKEKEALERIAVKLEIKDISTLLKLGIMKLIIEYELKEINNCDE